MATGKVISVNISKEKSAEKQAVPQIKITKNGIEGDAYSGTCCRQVTLLAIEEIEKLSEKLGRKINPGEFAENIITKGLNLSAVKMLDRFIIGKAELEVTQLGKGRRVSGCGIYKEIEKNTILRNGIFCRIISEGTVLPGDAITHKKIPLRVTVITCSDRIGRGEYEDKSSHAIMTLTEDFFADKPWELAFKNIVVPGEYEQLENAIRTAAHESSIIFITGGTGICPRDITPEIVEKVIDREIPGIMDFIRTKYGAKNPNALLSRSIAGIIKTTLIYAMPGNVKAVKEYMVEILKTIEHSVFMLNNISLH